MEQTPVPTPETSIASNELEKARKGFDLAAARYGDQIPPPESQDPRVWTIVLIALGTSIVTSIVGVVILSVLGKPTPEILTNIIVGLLAYLPGLLTQSPLRVKGK